MKHLLNKKLIVGVTALVTLQLTACGTILYPERKGQVQGQLDSGVVLLNAVGLLFFFVPGVIAFAVDFNNGTIYLPNGTAGLDSSENIDVVDIEGELSDEKIESVILEQTGQRIDLSADNVIKTDKSITLQNFALERSLQISQL